MYLFVPFYSCSDGGRRSLCPKDEEYLNLTDVEDDEKIDPNGIWIRFPSMSKNLAKLPVEIRKKLKEEAIHQYENLDEAIQNIFGDEMSAFILKPLPKLLFCICLIQGDAWS